MLRQALQAHRLHPASDAHRRRGETDRGLLHARADQVYIDEDDQLRVENNRPFEMLLDPEVNANALN
ncbi:hypothetical protein Rrhod_1209 [Rhodococcus rhodnii LMG 5362]|uniref:Uncharacterized protein n=1 Tax=Rhodococcus rhodnii LMG 5362 TaxID=1273125 RepID=R7WTE9_9NOCA|nr:hypothetical protein Rrhod_1209 [Rhodococcus rhodnii LMG 5362]